MKTKKLCVVAAMLGLLPLTMGCGTKGPDVPARVPECCADAPATTPAAEITRDSVYQLGSTWTDQSGKTRRLRDFAGSLQVVAMVFTNCQYACPQTLAALRKIEAEKATENVHFLLLSLDPDRDTVEVLRAYAQKEGIDTEHRWTLMRSDAGSVREIAAVLGIAYKQNPNGDFAHSNLVTLLDKNGRIVHRLEGLGADPAPLIAAIWKLSATPSR